MHGCSIYGPLSLFIIFELSLTMYHGIIGVILSSTSPGNMGDVIVTVAIDIQNSIKSDNSSASFELWFGDELLSADQVDVNMDYVKDFSVRCLRWSTFMLLH